ncbi:MAG: hypothetical protein P4L67_05275 [Candidatus Pacebacteria bacterium]|nr:hypothetical protein [Candidatus Paceibacterota bacterium]
MPKSHEARGGSGQTEENVPKRPAPTPTTQLDKRALAPAQQNLRDRDDPKVPAALRSHDECPHCGSRTGAQAYTPLRPAAKESLGRLSRENFDTKQYRSENRPEKRRDREVLHDEDCDTPEESVSVYNTEICKIMNDFYNSPTASKAYIPKIMAEVGLPTNMC